MNISDHEPPFVPVSAKSPYYIVSPPYERRSAGIRALHLLCHWLNRAGYPAYIHNFLEREGPFARPDLITPLLSPRVALDHLNAGLTPIVVYPEIFAGNPLQAPCVVRYVLNYPGLLGGDRQFDENEMIFAYSQHLAESIGSGAGVLCMPFVDTSVFHMPEPEDSPRVGSCFYAHKFCKSGGTLFGLPGDAVEILAQSPDAQTPEQIANLFRTCEKFYAFEDTALILEAALCGCPTIIMRSDFFQSPLTLAEYGPVLALDDDEAEIARARDRLGVVARRHEDVVRQFWRQFEGFVSVTQDRAARERPSRAVFEHLEAQATARSPELDDAERRVVTASLRSYVDQMRIKAYLFALSRRRREKYRKKRRMAQDLWARYRRLKLP